MNPWPAWHRCNAWCDGDRVHAFVGTFNGHEPRGGTIQTIDGVRVQVLDEALAPEAKRNLEHPEWPVYLVRVRVL